MSLKICLSAILTFIFVISAQAKTAEIESLVGEIQDKIFAGESLLLNIIGVLCGFFGGVALLQLVAQAYSTELFRFPVIIYPSRLVVSALLMLSFIGIAQFIIYVMIHRLHWSEALKVKE